MSKRKCDYCEQEALCICDFLWDKLIKIAWCEKHTPLAISQQNIERIRSECKSRSNKFYYWLNSNNY